jgi:phosphoesterase RecJ-like protein
VFELIRDQAFPLTLDVATNLYVAISTDTGSFQYSNTTARTYEIAAELVHVGLNVGRINQLLYESYPRRRLELLRVLLDSLRFEGGGRVGSFSLSLQSATRLGVLPEDNEGLIDHIRAVRGVIVAAFFEELDDGKVRVSMRSKDERYDVCRVAQQFGGGGHKLAAGARVRGTLAEVEKKVLEAICDIVGCES